MKARHTVLALLLVAVGLSLASVGLFVMAPAPSSAVFLALTALGIYWGVLGVFVIRRGGSPIVAALLAFVGVNLSFTLTREIAWMVLAASDTAFPQLEWIAALLRETTWWLVAAIALLFLYFPDGRLPGRRWRFVPPALIALTAVTHAWGVIDPTPFRPPLDHIERTFPEPPLAIGVVSVVAFIALLLLLLASALSPIIRFRQTKTRPRAQLKWLALVALALPAYLLVALAEVAITGEVQWASGAIGLLMLIVMPAAITLAILRHDLYDVDKVWAMAVSYAVASTVLAALFAVLAAGGGILVGGHASVTAAGATAITMLALAPVYRRVHAQVERRLYPSRAIAIRAIQELQRAIHAGDAQPEQLEEALQYALGDPGLRVAFVLPGGHGMADATGAAIAGDSGRSVPIELAGRQIGLLATEKELSSQLLREVASHSAVVVEVVRLRLELVRALNDVEASRARLIQVTDAERRRLERDLHDGAQQRLVSLGMSLRVAQRHLGNGSIDVDALIDQATAVIGTSVAELRRIAHGLRPSALDQGLGVALAALSRSVPLPVTLEVEAEGIPDEVATTVYYLANESFANSVKHAGATKIRLQVTRRDGHVDVNVEDDGRGGASVEDGSGLAGLRDRVSALGGSLAVESSPGLGTLIQATIPCTS